MLIKAERLDTSPIPQILEGILPNMGTGWWHGPSKCGKSFAIIKMLLDMANGVDWFGHKTIQCDVVYAIGEGAGDLGIRIKAQLAYHAQQVAAQAAIITERDGPDAAAKFMAEQPEYTSKRLFIETAAFSMPFGLDKKPSVSMLQFIASMGAKNVHPGLIVFDAQDDFADTKSTQNLTSASRFVAGHKYLAEQLSCFVLGVAHDTQDGKKMSGNVRFYSSCDISISVKPEQNGNSSGDSVTTVVNEKAKPGGIFEFKPFSFQALEQEWDEPLWDDDDPDLPIIDPDTGLQKTKLVKTYVVIPRADPEDGGDLSADPVDDGWSTPVAARDLPELRTPVRPPSIRNGIKPERTGISGVGKIILGILSEPCPEDGCDALAGASCNTEVPGAVHIGPHTDVHMSRAESAVAAGTVTPGHLIAAQYLAAQAA